MHNGQEEAHELSIGGAEADHEERCNDVGKEEKKRDPQPPAAITDEEQPVTTAGTDDNEEDGRNAPLSQEEVCKVAAHEDRCNNSQPGTDVGNRDNEDGNGHDSPVPPKAVHEVDVGDDDSFGKSSNDTGNDVNVKSRMSVIPKEEQSTAAADAAAKMHSSYYVPTKAGDGETSVGAERMTPHPHAGGYRQGSRRFSTSKYQRRSSPFSRLSDGGSGHGAAGPSQMTRSWNWAKIVRRRSSALPLRRSSDLEGEEDSGAKGAFHGGGGAEGSGPSALSRLSKLFSSRRHRALASSCRKAANHPWTILLPTVLTFAVLTTAGLSAIIRSANQYRNEETARLVEEGRLLAYELNDALARAQLPLFTLQELAGQLDEFHDLPRAMDWRTHPDQTPTFRDGGRAFRNATEICTDPAVTEPYHRAAASIFESSGMGKMLLTLQLQPHGVVCLSEPLVHTYNTGFVMDNSRAIGLDRLHDSFQGESARLSIEEREGVSVTGPITLVQDTAPAPHETLVYWAPIFLEGLGDMETLDNEIYDNFWGFAGVLLDWYEVMEEVGMHEFFSRFGIAYAVIEDGGDFSEDKIIAASSDAEPPTRETADEAFPIPMREGWHLLVDVPSPPVGDPTWRMWGSILVVVGSALVSLALMSILVSKTDHEELLCRRIPRNMVSKLHRGETVIECYDNATLCFIDIVSFTTMSGTMKAQEVMDMIQTLFSEFDRLALKHNCFNSETIGDAYLTISGGPEGNDAATGAANIAAFAVDAVDIANHLVFEGGRRIKIRVGVATGPVVAGVISTADVPKFTLFGETTSLAEEMEQTSRPGRVQCSETTMRLLRGNLKISGAFRCRGRTEEDGGSCDAEGRGKTWWIVRTSEGGSAAAHGDELDYVGGARVKVMGESLTVGSSLSRSELSTGGFGTSKDAAEVLSEKGTFVFENHLLSDNNTWQEDERTKSPTKSCWSYVNVLFRSVGNMVKVDCCQKILLKTLLVFAVLCGIGLAILFVFKSDYERQIREDLEDFANRFDRWLGKELSNALLPLFATSELIKVIGKWNDLPYEIDATPLYEKGTAVYDNVTGICNDNLYRDPFVDIASSIKQSSGMQKILVNVQLAPRGVLCLTYPKNNTEDFPPGVYLDTSGAIGLNLLETPNRADLSKQAVKEALTTVQGPIKLVQGKLSVVDEALIARYPVYIDGHNVSIDGHSYDFWGFTIVLLDWDKLKSKFVIYDFFSRVNLQFRMTRFDSFNQRTAIIANSSNHEILEGHNSISVELESSDNAWTLVVGYEDGFDPPWLPWGAACIFITSFLVSVLIMMVLATSKMHKRLLYRMMPKKAIQKLEHGET